MSRETVRAEILEYLQLLQKRGPYYQSDAVLQLITDEDVLLEYAHHHPERYPGIKFQSPWHILVLDLVQDVNGRQFVYERFLSELPIT